MQEIKHEVEAGYVYCPEELSTLKLEKKKKDCCGNRKEKEREVIK